MNKPPTFLLRAYTPEDEAFWRTLIFPEEERMALTSVSWNGGYRWFSSTNVVPIEHYRRPNSLPQRKAS
jgi:hypothetical protein